jgi:hypothetical protein
MNHKRPFVPSGFSCQLWNPNRKPHPQETKPPTQAMQEITITHTQSTTSTIQNPKENNTHPMPISTIQPPLTPNAENRKETTQKIPSTYHLTISSPPATTRNHSSQHLSLHRSARVPTLVSIVLSYTSHRRFLRSSNPFRILYPRACVLLWSHASSTTKKNCILPLSFRHVYGHNTRGEQFATCKWPRVRLMSDPGVTKCTFCRVYHNTRG